MRRKSTYELIQVELDRGKGFSHDQPPAETVTLMLPPKENDIPKLQRKITEDEEMKKNKERVSDGSSRSSNSRYNICQNKITGTKRATDVGISNFGNVVVQGQGGGKGMKGFPERGGAYNISGNIIRADGAKKVGIQNFGNTTYGRPFTTEEDHGEEAEGGSSPPRPQEGPTGELIIDHMDWEN